ncbi:MAG: amino acid ABC transporter permease [Zoogloeaceae bacterium]|jgi:polar amino acid transport system permease protein|nr:amino acid ABC transporter permease [Zoogloeaceae bacterium]
MENFSVLAAQIAQIALGGIVTLKLFLLTLLLAIPLGLALALMRLSCWQPLSLLINGYIWLMRGTPLMLQMLFIYFGLPILFPGLTIAAFPAAAIAFSLNYAAYFAEIFRGGIQSIGKGQREGAKALGFSYAQTMRKIILPQMVKKILAPFGNETITLVKDTSLVYVLAIYDLLKVAANIVNREFTIVPFLVAAVFYLVMTLLLTLLFQRLEKRYAVYDD